MTRVRRTRVSATDFTPPTRGATVRRGRAETDRSKAEKVRKDITLRLRSALKEYFEQAIDLAYDPDTIGNSRIATILLEQHIEGDADIEALGKAITITSQIDKLTEGDPAAAAMVKMTNFVEVRAAMLAADGDALPRYYTNTSVQVDYDSAHQSINAIMTHSMSEPSGVQVTPVQLVAAAKYTYNGYSPFSVPLSMLNDMACEGSTGLTLYVSMTVNNLSLYRTDFVSSTCLRLPRELRGLKLRPVNVELVDIMYLLTVGSVDSAMTMLKNVTNSVESWEVPLT